MDDDDSLFLLNKRKKRNKRKDGVCAQVCGERVVISGLPQCIFLLPCNSPWRRLKYFLCGALGFYFFDAPLPFSSLSQTQWFLPLLFFTMIAFILYTIYFLIVTIIAISVILYIYQCDLLYASGFPKGSRTKVKSVPRVVHP
jgi:hypothetical protein